MIMLPTLFFMRANSSRAPISLHRFSVEILEISLSTSLYKSCFLPILKVGLLIISNNNDAAAVAAADDDDDNVNKDPFYNYIQNVFK